MMYKYNLKCTLKMLGYDKKILSKFYTTCQEQEHPCQIIDNTYPRDSQNSGSKSSEVQVLLSLESFWPTTRPVHLKTGEVFLLKNKIKKAL